MRIAVVGAGLAGLAVSWFLTGRAEVTLFDHAGVGAGASGTSAGLLHPYTGIDAKVPWEGMRAFQEACQLLQEAAPAAFSKSGILRVATSERQRQSFSLSAHNNPQVEWVDDCRTIYPHLIQAPGILLKEGLLVQSQTYLNNLFKGCQKKGMIFKTDQVVSLSELSAYDQVVVALGADTGRLLPLKVRRVKGQTLLFKWPKSLPPLPLPVNGQLYLIPGEECIAGATYEKEPFSNEPDLGVVEAELLPKMAELIPALRSIEVVGCRAGVRGVLPGHKPFMGQIDNRTWVLTGFGSKGLLYHAWLGRCLSEAILRCHCQAVESTDPKSE